MRRGRTPFRKQHGRRPANGPGPPSSIWVNEFRMGYNRSGFGLLPNDTKLFANGKDYPLNTGITSTGGFPAVYIRGLAPNFHLGSQPGRPLESYGNPYWNFQDHVSYLKGKHAFKFGLDIALIKANSNAHDNRG